MVAKNGFNTQWGLVSSDGTRAGAGFASLSPGEGAPPLVDEEGRLWTRAIDPALMMPVGSFAVAAAVASGPLPVLPAAPPDALWYVLNGNVQGAGATSWSIREEVPSEVVRPMDVRTVAFSGAAAQPGGIATQGPLVLENTGLNALTYTGSVFLLPAAFFQRFWLSLTNAFQVIPVALAAAMVARTPYFGPVTAAAFNNGDVAARTFELRFTRGATTIVNPNSATPAGTRTTPIAFASLFPPLEPGDVLEARTTAAPALGSCFVNGLLQSSPAIPLP